MRTRRSTRLLIWSSSRCQYHWSGNYKCRFRRKSTWFFYSSLVSCRLSSDFYSFVRIWLTRTSGCIASIVRMTYLIGSSKTKDPTWGSYSALMWTVIEANISIICACLPPLRGPAAAAFRRMRGQEGPSTHDQSYNMKALSSAKQRKASLMGITELSNWQKRTENSAFATKGEEYATPRSGSEESIIPRALSVGITKTTKWEVCESDVLQSDVPEVPKLVHSKV